ncbi:MAG: carbamoyltransferase HypF [Propionibacteriaceae bacterium]|nr:carbamoyltransferase HypF [Propionibacteriaceae bacterium]
MSITGVVQGVGFRPHVARIASGYPVTGLCGNDDNSVFIEVQGLPADVDAFCRAVVTDIPPMASIVSSRQNEAATIPGETSFRIVASRRAAGAITLIPADGAVCDDCVADLTDPENRRYGYPFTTCTNCGPRLSIIRDVPYDRPLTTMAEFPMCEACRKEYEDPSDRRYHAQPISCFDCGPHLWLEIVDHESGDDQSAPEHSLRAAGHDGPSNVTGQSSGLARAGHPEDAGNFPTDPRTQIADTIQTAKNLLRQGKILAVKGIGGFTLMCDARNEQAVATLRARKHRGGKPLAVMAGCLATAESIADLDEAQTRVLTGREAPIVLAPMGAEYDLAASVAPGLDDIGVMLPYAPLHRLLLDDTDVLVATSANSSSKPLTYLNEDARTDLSQIVDAFLLHDRGIHVPVEDSVVMADGDQTRPIRRSRGYAPLPVFLSDADHCVLAVGAELKNTFALTRDGMAFLSAHIGDMGSWETQRAYEKSVAQMLDAHRRTPELIVVDKHPGYFTHSWGLRRAERDGVPVLEIQHHHAHALSLMAEAGIHGPWTCVVLDGTGYGDDGTIWGGEVLGLGDDPLTYERLWHLPGFWLPGGDSAVRNPWKSAMGLLWEYDVDPAQIRAWSGSLSDDQETAQPGSAPHRGNPPSERLTPPDHHDRRGTDVVPLASGQPTPEEMALVTSQLQGQVAVVRTSSTGRLFDAVASLLGICHQVTYEAQAAMELQTWAERCTHNHHPPVRHMKQLVDMLVLGQQRGEPAECLARTFHIGLARLIASAIDALPATPGPIGLTGGVFANRLFAWDLTRELRDRGHETLQHQVVPSNDGGLSLGQAYAGYLSLIESFRLPGR